MSRIRPGDTQKLQETAAVTNKCKKCVCVCAMCRVGVAWRQLKMVTERKEVFGLAEILYCCLTADKRILISRLEKHNNTIEADSASAGEGAQCVCQLIHLYKQMFCVCVCGFCSFSNTKRAKIDEESYFQTRP